ncbi:MarR family winged helix-turn-helix transcriptional regulator [Limnochorda pilosa]|uniref:MarR family transcriptional regulator n=1 Tax=Limnochorda pilosa TaxID=1555112 RepID=A0A0K2SHC8_LIMPI|nr:MarR family transcriptional regulator [Limnochorda pilosa]BAS26526.1 MarR family transcriptional regulator [Limnochorda pilosa]
MTRTTQRSTQGDQTTELLIQLDEAWTRLSRRIAGDLQQELPTTVPAGQAYLLRLLGRRGELRMSDLSTHLGATLSGCTALVDRAVEAGWVARNRDEDDRRVVWVRLTPAGEALLADLKARRAALLARYLKTLRPEELEEFVRLLKRVAGSLDDPEEAAQPEPRCGKDGGA